MENNPIQVNVGEGSYLNFSVTPTDLDLYEWQANGWFGTYYDGTGGATVDLQKNQDIPGDWSLNIIANAAGEGDVVISFYMNGVSEYIACEILEGTVDKYELSKLSEIETLNISSPFYNNFMFNVSPDTVDLVDMESKQLLRTTFKNNTNPGVDFLESNNVEHRYGGLYSYTLMPTTRAETEGEFGVVVKNPDGTETELTQNVHISDSGVVFKAPIWMPDGITDLIAEGTYSTTTEISNTAYAPIGGNNLVTIYGAEVIKNERISGSQSEITFKPTEPGKVTISGYWHRTESDILINTVEYNVISQPVDYTFTLNENNPTSLAYGDVAFIKFEINESFEINWYRSVGLFDIYVENNEGQRLAHMANLYTDWNASDPSKSFVAGLECINGVEPGEGQLIIEIINTDGEFTQHKTDFEIVENQIVGSWHTYPQDIALNESTNVYYTIEENPLDIITSGFTITTDTKEFIVQSEGSYLVGFFTQPGEYHFMAIVNGVTLSEHTINV